MSIETPKRVTRLSGFTLIELLIVVAIIAILAAIAVPNFLEAQMRAKVARVKADSRTIATGLEAYAVDWNAYPHMQYLVNIQKNQFNRDAIAFATGLSTPIAYLTSLNSLVDPFSKEGCENGYVLGSSRACTLTYVNIQLYERQRNPPTSGKHFSQWLIFSMGPDFRKGPRPDGNGSWNNSRYARLEPFLTMATRAAWEYDPTNGSVSNGDILRWQ